MKDNSPNCIVIDDAQPPNISLDVVRARPDVLVVKCLSQVPRLQYPFDFELFDGTAHASKQNIVFTCLTETIMLAASSHTGHFTIGPPRPEQLLHVAGMASKYDIDIAPFHSFAEIGFVGDSHILGSASRWSNRL